MGFGRADASAARAAAFAGGGFGGVHACCLPRVVACNDLAFTEAVFPPGDPRTQKNNLTQRNLSVV